VKKVRGDGVDLAVFERGDPAAPTVLLVHGYPDTHLLWDEVAERLKDHYHVVTYDVRGAGASSHPIGSQSYSFEHLVADMAAVLDAVAPDRKVHLVGHDWGSIQSWEAVCTMSGRFASFTSISGPCLDHAAAWTRGRLRHPSPRNLRQAAGQGVRSWYISFFQTPVLPELVWRTGLAGLALKPLRRDGHPAALDGAAGVGLYRANMPERWRHPRPRRTDVPTQVIVPLKDWFVSPHLVGGLQGRVPGLRIRTIAAGHWVPRSHPEVIARWIGEHIAGEPTRGLRKATVRKARRRFESDLVVVTGAGSGIGRATALAFAEAGAEVIVADLDLPSARRTAQLCGGLGPAAQAYEVDVSDAEAMTGFAETVRHQHGVADIVVNNGVSAWPARSWTTRWPTGSRCSTSTCGGSSTVPGCSPPRCWLAARAGTSSTSRRPRPTSRRGCYRPTAPARRQCSCSANACGPSWPGRASASPRSAPAWSIPTSPRPHGSSAAPRSSRSRTGGGPPASMPGAASAPNGSPNRSSRRSAPTGPWCR